MTKIQHMGDTCAKFAAQVTNTPIPTFLQKHLGRVSFSRLKRQHVCRWMREARNALIMSMWRITIEAERSKPMNPEENGNRWVFNRRV